MRKGLLILALAVVSAVALSSCGTQQRMHLAQFNSITIKRAPQQNFYDLDRGLEVKVLPTQPVSENSGYTYHMSGKSFYLAPTIQYVRSMGLTEMNPNTDYRLYIKINQADVDGFKGGANVVLEVSLENEKGKEVFTQKNISGIGNALTTFAHFGLDEAYTQALEQINWNRIASFLRTEQLPKDEPDKQVQGLGDTALEQTIIRWDVQSRPQGADIFWRVVSKTPEVKSTNNKYLMTTPYEATKALDIKGLTYQTSGNVRIILRCEKDGYMSQEKEFDVRMVLDQEEISAFFRLVKEE